jgi:hypothetical protein
VARKPKLGSGARFKALAKKTSPALAAYIGRKKYGAKKMAKMSATGRKRASTRRKRAGY